MTMKKFDKTTAYIVLAALAGGLLIGRYALAPKAGTGQGQGDQAVAENTIWTCSMHPQIRQAGPGKCPICGMDLIPLTAGHADEGPLEIRMSPTAMQLAEVQTTVVRRQLPVKQVRLNGKVRADERRIYSQASHLAGRIESLAVSFTGEHVNRGQELAQVYSPDLVTAQEELFEAAKIRDVQPELYRASRDKLLSWKLTERQVDAILAEGTPRRRFPILADVTGDVLDKRVNVGDYVTRGESLFEVADLSVIWVLFDVYESDIPWIRKGDNVVFSVQSIPGERFTGRIDFVDPVINARTRVSTARIEMPNPGMKLKPGMFTEGIVSSPVQGRKEQLVVPRSAVLWTGERSLVYVRDQDPASTTFVMREVTLGPALGDGYIVTAGLEEGAEVVTNGAFSIDAAAQLAGKPSMMNPGGAAMAPGDSVAAAGAAVRTGPYTLDAKTRKAMDNLFVRYLALKDALVDDDLAAGKQAAAALLDAIDRIDMTAFDAAAHKAWMERAGPAGQALRAAGKATNIGEARQHFNRLSDELILVAVAFGPFDVPLYIQHCPMANNNRGADWISADAKILNPYFGKSMLGCGSTIREIK